jgi:hypothetical protein
MHNTHERTAALPPPDAERNLMATEKQIAANRRNALRSTGPRTPEGKAVSSRNAACFDLSDRRFILATECPREFERFLRCFYEEHKPATPTEVTLVDTMAIARWRLIRMAGFEAAVIDHESQSGNFDARLPSRGEALLVPDPVVPPTPVRTSLSYCRTADSGRSLQTMSRSESRLQQQFNGAFDRLTRLRVLAQRTAMKDAQGK